MKSATFRYMLYYDSVESTPFMACDLLPPILTFLCAPGPWKNRLDRDEIETLLMKNGIVEVVAEGGGRGRKLISILVDQKTLEELNSGK